MMTETEIWDLYDSRRQKTGQTIKRGDPVPRGCYHLTIRVCIFNRDGKMLIQQRQPFKDGWPNRWDLTVGGCAAAGETSRQAAEREVFEELGYALSLPDAPPAVTISTKNAINDNYILIRDLDLAELTLQPEEVQAVQWASMEQIFQMIDDGRFIPFHKSFIAYLFSRSAAL